MSKQKWYWVVVTTKGILTGDLEGEKEKGETDADASEHVAGVIINSLVNDFDFPANHLLACLVSETAIHASAGPKTNLQDLHMNWSMKTQG